MKKFYLVAAFLMTSLMVKGQEGKYQVLFASKTVQLEEGFSQKNLFDGDQPVHGRFIRLLQIRRPFLGNEKSQLEKMGIQFHDYIPYNAFIVSFPENFDVNRLPKSLVRSIENIQSDWRISESLYLNDIPSWAVKPNNHLELVLVPAPFLSQEQVVRLLDMCGVRMEILRFRGKYVDVIASKDEIENLSKLNFLTFIHPGEEPGVPENDRSRSASKVSMLNNRYGIATNFDGSGVIVSLGDDGDIGPHIDYAGRLTSVAGASNGDHGDHVAGTIFGAGNRDPRGMGMAPGAEMLYYSYPGNLNNAAQDYNTVGIRITSSSYSNGCNAGYTTFARDIDLTSFLNPKLIHVFSAGNNGTQDCSYGAGATWGNITGGHKVGKNAIAVANLTHEDALAGSSSRGPASDGRIKPDVGTVGSSVYSTTDPHNYNVKTGTSMSCPGVSGSLAIIYQAFKESHNQVEPDGGLAKAHLMNTADDLGNAGPDFRFGFGKINVPRAIQAIQSNWDLTDSIATGQTKNHTITVPSNTAEVRVMLYWTDPPGSVSSARALVNDLNMTTTNNNQTYLPWVLDPTPNPTNLNSPAVRATDSLNNVEQVTILNPVGDVNVTVSGIVPMGSPQKYFIVYYFVADEVKITHPAGGESLVPGETVQIRWDASPGTGNFQIEYSSNNGQTWINLGTTNANLRHRNWTVPNTVTGQGLIRVTRGNQVAQSPSNFTIFSQANGLNIQSACPDSLVFTWNNVAGATGYVIYKLGNKYMDSIGFSTTNSFVINPFNPVTGMWVTVAPRGANNAIGRRSRALEVSPGLSNCFLNRDIAMDALINPKPGKFPSCQTITGVQYEISNKGVSHLTNIPVGYRINQGPIYWDTVAGPIAPNQTVLVTASHVPILAAGTHQIAIFNNMIDDGNPYNDTIFSSIEIFPSSSITLPYSENFGGMSLCTNRSACGNDNCSLGLGWVNETNGNQDNIDWLVRNGSSPSGGTGPSRAFTPATNSGQYLLIEATGCFEQEARLISPCINLTNASLPEMSFRYHMFGTDMGVLHVDVLVDGKVQQDIIPVLAGDKGDNWLLQKIDLTPYVGKTINVVFRAITGSGFRSDMGLDAIEIYEATSPPTAAFTLSNPAPCINTEVVLKETGALVQSRLWDITPSTFNLTQGSTLTSKELFVEFTANGTYTIKLTTTNAFGQDSVTVNQAVTVTPGVNYTIVEDFTLGIPPLGWQITNPDNNETWKPSGTVISANGLSYNSVPMVECFNYSLLNQSDYLKLPKMDLSGFVGPVLKFDVAYARRNAQSMDGLEIELSTDCGQTFDTILYSKFGADLATSANTTNSFVPTATTMWRVETIDLSAFKVSDVVIRFKSTNANGNNMYILNVNVVDTTVTPPTPIINTNQADVCRFDTLVFFGSGTNNPIHYVWDFGLGATPATATGAGPHPVTYQFIGTGRSVRLSVYNAGGMSSSFSNQFSVLPLPVASFTQNILGNQVTFNNQSLGNPSAYFWDFGDGNTSTAASPTHTYTTGGVYQVYLAIQTDCGPDTLRRQISFTNISTSDPQLGLNNLVVSPNPTKGDLFINIEKPENKALQFSIKDLAGRVVLEESYNLYKSNGAARLDLSRLAKGSYMLTIADEASVRVIKIILQ